MDVQRKVTAFVTNGSARDAELCVFWHPASGTQVPAGSVEDGESYDAAARREAAEETGLPHLELVAELGARRTPAPPGQAWIAHEAIPRTEPYADAPAADWTLVRTVVDVLDQANGHTRVRYHELDLDGPVQTPATVRARFDGWVPDDCVTSVQERAFFHLRTTVPPPRDWRQRAEPEHVFHLRWLPLFPPHIGLVPGMQAWLAEFHADLAANV